MISVCQRCGKKALLVCRVRSDLLDVMCCDACLFQALRLIVNFHEAEVEGKLRVERLGRKENSKWLT
jgi:hypothetical protein